MADFNPIRDLRSPEVDPFNVPAGQSTQEVEQIRLRLVLTKEKTEDIVKLIKRKGLVFKKDVEKIQELQRRLRKTIPRIPILRGDASVQGGSERETMRRGGLDLDFNRFRTTSTKPVRDPFPILDIIITAVLLRLGIRKQVKVQGGNKIIKFFRVKTNEPVKAKEFIKILEKEFAKTKNPAYLTLIRQLKLSQATQQKSISQKEGFDYFSKKFANIKVEPNFIKSPAEIKRENIKKTLLEAEEKIGLFDKKVKVDRESFFNRGKVKNAAPESAGFAEKFKNTFKGIFKSKEDRELEYLNKEIDRLSKKLKEITGSNTIDEATKKVEIKRLLEQLFKNNEKRRPIKKNFGSKSDSGVPLSFNLNDKFSSKPMNNDIAMLNTDTSYRDIIIIDRGQA